VELARHQLQVLSAGGVAAELQRSVVSKQMARAVLEHQREFVEGLVGSGLLSRKQAGPMLHNVAGDLVARSRKSRALVREVAKQAVTQQVAKGKNTHQ
jgi:translation elongation factor EF-Ts